MGWPIPRIFLTVPALVGLLAPGTVVRARTAPTLEIGPSTRALIIAPHPDDEVLGSGGLMQHVHEAGGAVKVVYLTDGDGYPEGVMVENHVKAPTARDYRGYGLRRREEARAALKTLHLDADAATFLSFPDGGLRGMLTKYWSERRRPYRSPYTRLDRPLKSDVVVPDTEYRGEDLTQELAVLIGTFKPTIIVVPRVEDQQPDHCAAPYFVADALGDVERLEPEYRPDVVNYIVHFNEWPFEDDRPDLVPPPRLAGGISGWMKLPLTPDERHAKRSALHRFQSQVHVMKWFLDGFARSNEVFSRPAPRRIVLPLKRNPCDI